MNAAPKSAVSVSLPLKMRSCPFSVGGAGANCISPRPSSTSPVTPSPLIAWNT